MNRIIGPNSFLLITAFVLSACAGPVTNLSSEERAAIKSVSIEVVGPRTPPNFYTSEQEMAGFTAFVFSGPLHVGDAQDKAGKGPAEAFGAFLAANRIDVSEIARSALEAELSRAGFVLSKGSTGSSRLVVQIGRHGFNQAKLWSNQLKPDFYLSATLYGTDGKPLVGKLVGYSGIFADIPTHSGQELISNPLLIAQLFKIAASNASKELVQRLSGK